jgi:hypothetical protein
MGERHHRIPGMWQQLSEMGVMGLLASEAAGGFAMSGDRFGRFARRPVVPSCPSLHRGACRGSCCYVTTTHADEGCWTSRVWRCTVGVGLARSPYVAYADRRGLCCWRKVTTSISCPVPRSHHAHRAVGFLAPVVLCEVGLLGDGAHRLGRRRSPAQADALNRGALGAAANRIGLASVDGRRDRRLCRRTRTVR